MYTLVGRVTIITCSNFGGKPSGDSRLVVPTSTVMALDRFFCLQKSLHEDLSSVLVASQSCIVVYDLVRHYGLQTSLLRGSCRYFLQQLVLSSHLPEADADVISDEGI